jgi:hypothetical protein
MFKVNRHKFFNYYLPTGISVVLVVAAGIGYLVFITHAGGGTGGNGTHGFYVQQGGKFRQRGGKVEIGGTSYSIPAYVQGCVNSSGTGAVTCAMGSSIKTGDLLVVTTKGDFPTLSVTTSAGVSCTWNQIFGQTLFTIASDGSAANVAQYYCNVPSTGAETVIASWSGAGSSYGANFADIEVTEYSNASGFVLGGLDRTSSAVINDPGGSTCSTGTTGTLTQANELVIATCNTWNSAQTWGAVAGYTNRATSSRNTSGWYDKSVSSTSGVSWSKTITSDDSVGFIATFKLQ